MPIQQTTVLEITCDNSACPGNDLDPTDRTGWTFMTAEVYGEATTQHVYCCPMCAGTISQALEAAASA